jgi:UDP-3-O-[3-hydroxymyristoyl] glucosamine N-acyltransferase
MLRLSDAVPVSEIVRLLAGRLVRGAERLRIDRLATLESADSASIAFLSSRAYRDRARASAAGVVVTSAEMADAVPANAALIEVPDPYRAYGLIARQFDAWINPRSNLSVHPSAVIASSATLGLGVAIGPGAVVGERVRVGARAIIGAGCIIEDDAVVGVGAELRSRVTLGHRCVVGDRSLIHAGTVIGSDGFGFARHQGQWEKIPQLGRVQIGTDVEIGANCAIDRGALDDTVIGDGCKLDNLIQVAHNVQIGEHTAIAACVGIAGSARIGRRCMIGGAAGILGHLDICDDVTISAMSLVSSSITKPGFYSGIFPLMDNADWERAAVVVRKLPELRARLRRIESHLKEN